MPNKRPKTEDFLTFLCFRGSSALPPHLDFLNQGKSKEPERPVKKPTIKPVIKKKGKKGRPPKNAKQKEDNVPAKTEESEVNKKVEVAPEENQTNTNENAEKNKNPEKVQVEVDEKEEEEEEEDDNVPTFAVRKRAEVVADGNRRSNRSNADEKCNNSTETSKRRSIQLRQTPLESKSAYKQHWLSVAFIGTCYGCNCTNAACRNAFLGLLLVPRPSRFVVDRIFTYRCL